MPEKNLANRQMNQNQRGHQKRNVSRRVSIVGVICLSLLLSSCARSNRGAVGLPGPTGSPGPQGDVGPQGPQGDVGVAGDSGAVGATGDPGIPGVRGLQGLRGLTGLSGGLGDQDYPYCFIS